ncbi:cytochrome P450 82A3-like [Hibiscus syriacus]|uniref:Cytochrome P450 82A3-like n=1 Tax=Hibiscus syriacus TaxID=106335 RepID=A0A6A3BAI0_HIBSY|nr:cytochrome P450 82A3-like [Hibiscus syriacus]
MAIRPALLYGSECWATKKDHVRRIEAAEMRMLRWTCGKTLRDMTTNSAIRDVLGGGVCFRKIEGGKTTVVFHGSYSQPGVGGSLLPYLPLTPYIWELGFVVVVVVVGIGSSNKLKRSNGKAAPEAGGAWPIIGHHPLLGDSKAAHVTLGALADKLGPAFTIRLGVHQALVVSPREVAKEIFTTNDMAVSSRSKMETAEHMGYNYAMFGFSPYGHYWREMRKITMLEVLPNHRIDQLKKVFVSEIEGSLKDLHKFCGAKKTGEFGVESVDMKKRFSDLTLNVILRTVTGKGYSGFAKEEQQVVSRYRKALRDFFYLSGIFVIGDAVPFLRKLDLGGYESWMKKTAAELDDVVGGWLNEHRKNGVWDESEQERDFMDDFSRWRYDNSYPNLSTFPTAEQTSFTQKGPRRTRYTCWQGQARARIRHYKSCSIGGYEIPDSLSRESTRETGLDVLLEVLNGFRFHQGCHSGGDGKGTRGLLWVMDWDCKVAFC